MNFFFLFFLSFLISSVFSSDESVDSSQYGFQADVRSLLNILINSLYTNRDIFLRELVSNASDALDKIRFLSLSDKSKLDGYEELEIKILIDQENNTISIRDSGIGMTKDELRKNLGSIAKSGTSEFLKAVQSGGDSSNLIGQFGVGFYSSFLVADRVDVISKSNDSDKQYIWSSDASSSFTISEDPRGNTLLRGTEIRLHIKEDAKDYLSNDKIDSILERYANFINFPIYLWTDKERELKASSYDVRSHVDTYADEDGEFTDDENDFPDLEDLKSEDSESILNEHYEKYEREDEEDQRPPGPVPGEEGSEGSEEGADEEEKEPEFRWIQMNSNKPLWTRKPNEVTEEEHLEFFRSITTKAEDLMTHTHFVAESATVSFTGLFYIPFRKPVQLFDDKDNLHNIKLYIRRVFITDSFDEIIPRYINFVKGIIDSDDLPLNVNREMLSENKKLKIMRKKILRKVIAMISSLAKPESDSEEDIAAAKDKYKKFWNQYHQNIKLGIIQDQVNRIRLASLLRFYTSENPDDLLSLDEVIKKSKSGDKMIYFIAGENKDTLAASPIIQKLVNEGEIVLLLEENIDEYTMSSLKTYKKRILVDASKENPYLEKTETDETFDEMNELYDPFLKYVKNYLGDTKVSKVLLTKRLSDAPSMLITEKFGYSANMERIVSGQALGDAVISKVLKSKRVFALNPYHPIVYKLALNFMKKRGKYTDNYITILYEYSAISSGFPISDIPYFLNNLNNMLIEGLKLNDEDDDYNSKEDIISNLKSAKDEMKMFNSGTDDFDINDVVGGTGPDGKQYSEEELKKVLEEMNKNNQNMNAEATSEQNEEDYIELNEENDVLIEDEDEHDL